MFALAVDPEEALLEYLEMFYKLGRAGRGAAPDRRDRLRHHHRAGHARRAADRQGLRGGTPPQGGPQRPDVYDAVVLDAPPTGRITRFLGVNAEVAGLAKVGPIRGQADAIMGLLTSPQTAVHVVTLLEEMPVQETADAVAELTAAGLPVGGDHRQRGARAAAARSADLTAAAKGRLDRAPSWPAGSAAAGGSVRDGAVDGLLAEAAEHAERVALEKAERRTLKALGRPTYELPLLAEGVDLGASTSWPSGSAPQGAA